MHMKSFFAVAFLAMANACTTPQKAIDWCVTKGYVTAKSRSQWGTESWSQCNYGSRQTCGGYYYHGYKYYNDASNCKTPTSTSICNTKQLCDATHTENCFCGGTDSSNLCLASDGKSCHDNVCTTEKCNAPGGYFSTGMCGDKIVHPTATCASTPCNGDDEQTCCVPKDTCANYACDPGTYLDDPSITCAGIQCQQHECCRSKTSLYDEQHSKLDRSNLYSSTLVDSDPRAVQCRAKGQCFEVSTASSVFNAAS